MVSYKLRPDEKIAAERIYDGMAVVVDEHLEIIHGLETYTVAVPGELAELVCVGLNGNEYPAADC